MVRPSSAGRRLGTSASGTVLLAEILVGLSTGYLLTLLTAAFVAKRAKRGCRESPGERRFLIVIPAHDEAAGLGQTLASLGRLDYPARRFEIVVIADNCRDQTAEVARAAGATVYERHDPSRRGKGYALRWALDRLAVERPEADAILFLDADCTVSPNLLQVIEAEMLAGAEAVQVNDVVANPDISWAAGLRYAAFVLFNTVRPLGKDALGFSAGLHGTGMAFSTALLARLPWESYSLAEDLDYHSRLVAAGERVRFAPDAQVASAMPSSLREAHDQQSRWEGGRAQMIRRWTPHFIREGLRLRDIRLLQAGFDPLVPPQTLLFGLNLSLSGLAVTLRSRWARRLGFVNLVGQVGYVLGGLTLIGVPRGVYRALAMAPVLILWKAWLYLRLATGRGPASWVRTVREPSEVEK